MPILANVLLSVDGPSLLRVVATDLYLAVAGKMPADVLKGGSVAISAKDLLDRVKMMPDGPLTLASQENASTTLRAQGSARKYTLRGLPGLDFPPIPTPFEGSPTLSLDVAVLSSLITKTHYAISTDETRAHLNSALFEWDGDVVRMVTTDGHRLSKMELKVAGPKASATMLLPLKAVQELRRLCDDSATETSRDGRKDGSALYVQVTQSGSSAFFQTPDTTFSVKLVDAQFPPYAQVIPKASDKTVRVPRSLFADALRAVSIAASERTGGVKLSIAKGVMTIASESPDTGDGVDEVPVEYTGSPMTIGFNAKYFLDVLGSLEEEDVLLCLGGELDPAVLRVPNKDEFLAVVMPMRI